MYLENIKEFQRNKFKLNSRTLNPNALIVSQAMLEVFQPKNIIVSIFGLKEGVRYGMLPKIEKKSGYSTTESNLLLQVPIGDNKF